MFRFLGIDPPAPKVAKFSQKEYDSTKRVRSFQPKWLQDFPWLEHHVINSEPKMFCKLCRKVDTVGSFVLGSANFKLDAIRAHEQSKSHVKYDLMNEAKVAPLGTSAAEKLLKDLDKSLFGRMTNLFRNAHALAKHVRPFSPLNRHNLKESFKVFDRQPLMPTRVVATRWLPHTVRAVQNVLKSYGPLTTHLTQLQTDGSQKSDRAAKARNFLHLLKSRDCVYFLHFLLDLSTCLSQVSLAFQTRTATVADIYEEIEAAKAILELFKKENGTNLASLSVSGNEVDAFDNQPLLGSDVCFPSSKRKMLDLLINSLDKRFGVDGPLIKATSVATLSLWPKKLQEQPEFGDDSMKILRDQFGPMLDANGFSSEGLLADWTRLKTLLYNSFDGVPDLSWERIQQSFHSKTPSVLALIDLILSLPASSADTERGFSCMKIVKSDWRSRLSDKSLSDLMMVQMETPAIEDFVPDNSIHAWHGNGQRMPNFKEAKPLHLNRVNVDKPIQVLGEREDGGAVDKPADEVQNIEPAVNMVNEDHVEIDEGFDDAWSDYSDTDDTLNLQAKRAYALFREDMLSLSE